MSNFQLYIFVLLFLLIHGISEAAESKTSLYGSARASLFVIDDGDDTHLSIENHSSRLGFKGEEELGGEISIVGHFEIGVNTAEGTFGAGESANRLAYLQLKTGLGQITIGTQWGAYYLMAGSITDNFNALGARHINPTFRLSRSLGYWASFGSARVMASAVLNSDDEDDDDVLDRYQIGAQFKAVNVTIVTGLDSLSESLTGTESGNAFSVGAVLRKDKFTFAASFTNTDASVATLNAGTLTIPGVDTAPATTTNKESHESAKKSVEIYAAYDLANRDQIRILFGQSDVQYIDSTETSVSATPSTLTLGYQKKLSGTTRWWIEAEIEDPDLKNTDNLVRASLGFRHDW